MAAEDTLDFAVNLPGVTDVADNVEVGKVYEVGINGVGYMLADHPETERRWSRRTVPLEPQRFATSETPFSQSIERYSFLKMDDWTDGRDQRFYDREASSAAAFFEGEMVDPFTSQGEVTLLPTTELEKSTTYATPHLVVVGDVAYVLTGQNTLEYSSDGTTWTPITLTDGLEGTTLTVESLTTDGQYWYAATGRSIIRGTTSDPAGEWALREARDEIQSIVIDAVAGTFTLSYSGQGPTGALDAVDAPHEAVAAQGRLTMDSQPVNADTFTVDTKTYTWETTLTNVDGNIHIGSDLAESQANLVAAFDLSGVAGTDYATAMTAHPSCSIGPFSGNNAVITADAGGLAGNSYETTETFTAATNVFDDVTLGLTRIGQNGVKTELEKLSNITTVTVTGAGTEAEPFLVQFENPGSADLALMTGSDALLEGGTVTIAEAQAGNGTTDWIDATEVKYAGGRICAAVIASGSTPNRFTTLTQSGDEERISGHITLAEGHTITLGGSVNGYIYFGDWAGTSGRIYAWPLGLDSSGSFQIPFVAWELPNGLIPKAVETAGSEVWVRAYRPEGTTAGSADLYRAIPSDDGTLTPFYVAEIAEPGGSLDLSSGEFSTWDDMVFFAWPNMTDAGDAGIGAVNLRTGGHAKWLRAASTSTKLTRSVDVWKGRPVFTVDTKGVYWASDTAYETSGYIASSIGAGSSSLDKVWDEITLVTRPITSPETVAVQTTLDSGGSYSAFQTHSTAGATKSNWTYAQKNETLGLKIVLGGDGTSTPTVQFVSSRYHMLGLSDTVLVLPVNCGDNLTGLNGAPLPGNGSGVGAGRARTLESLTQTRVKIQDVDWHLTGASDVYEVLAAETDRIVGLYDRSKPSAQMTLVCVMTMRKVGTA